MINQPIPPTAPKINQEINEPTRTRKQEDDEEIKQLREEVKELKGKVQILINVLEQVKNELRAAKKNG